MTPAQEVLRLVIRAPQSMPSLLRSFRITGVRSVHMPTLVNSLLEDGLIVMRANHFEATDDGRAEIAKMEKNLQDGNIRYSAVMPVLQPEEAQTLFRMHAARPGAEDANAIRSRGMRC